MFKIKNSDFSILKNHELGNIVKLKHFLLLCLTWSLIKNYAILDPEQHKCSDHVFM